MVRSCEQAVAVGLPAIAFTEHLEFTVGGTGDAIVDVATDHRWWSRIKRDRNLYRRNQWRRGASRLLIYQCRGLWEGVRRHEWEFKRVGVHFPA